MLGEISKHLSTAAVMHMLACGGGRADTSRAPELRESIPQQVFNFNSSHVSSSSACTFSTPSQPAGACYPCPDVIIFIISVALTAARLTSWHLISFS